MQEAIAELQARVAGLERRVADLEPPKLTIPRSSESDPVPRDEIGPARPSVPDVVSRERRHGSAEEEVLGKWFPRFGALALVLGAAFGFHYAVDQGWIGPQLRVLLGVLLGGGLIVAGEASRKAGWTPYASAISGGGVGVLYLCLWASVRIYELVPPGAGLVGLAGVSGLGIWLALRHGAQPLAVIALAGGFAAPFVSGAASGAPGVTYLYVFALDVVAVFLGIRSGWRLPAKVAFAASWAIAPVGFESAALWATGTTALFLMFGMLPYVRASRDPNPATDAGAIVVNGLVYSLALFARFPGSDGAIALGLTLVYALAAVVLRDHAPEARAIRGATTGMALLGAFVWVPAQLDGELVTLGWALEGLAIVSATGALRSRLAGAAPWGTAVGCAFVCASIGVQVLAATAGPDAIVHTMHGRLVALFAVSAFVVAAGVEGRRPSPLRDAGAGAVVAANVLALSWASLELYVSLAGPGAAPDAADLQFGLSALWSVYAAGLMAAGLLGRSHTCRVMSIALFGVTAGKMVLRDLWLLDTLQRLAGFMGIGVLLLIASLGYNAFREMLFGEEARR